MKVDKNLLDAAIDAILASDNVINDFDKLEKELITRFKVNEQRAHSYLILAIITVVDGL